MFLGIDPGRDTGWAVLDEGGRLTRCGLGNPPAVAKGRRVIIERPQVYAPRYSKGDPNDLITLAIQVGRYSERFDTDNHVLPHEWKGTIDKEKHHERIWCSLGPLEQDVVARAMNGIAVKKRHNAMDAVGLAKWAYANRRFA